MGIAMATAQCVTTLQMSTGYMQSASSLIPDNNPDDDWLLTQVPAGTSATLGQPGYIIPKHSGYHWAGSGATAKYMNFQNSTGGPGNWYNNTLPIVYQNGFCVCPGGESVPITIDLALHCDNWAEVWLLDASGNPVAGVPQPLVTQTHQEITANFLDPEDMATIPLTLLPGSYSLALLQRNKTSITAVSLDATISMNLPELMYGSSCSFVPFLPGTFPGSPVTEDPNSGGGNNGGGGPGSNCQTTLVASTGYDQDNAVMLNDHQPDVDWILTQLPTGTSGALGQPATVVPKLGIHDWAGTTAKYINYHNGHSGPTNWYNNTLPIMYQNAFCVCAEEAEVSFDLLLHSDNWAEVWLLDDNGNPVTLLLSQTHQSNPLNYTDPEDPANVAITLQGGQYSLALLQRNDGGPTAVSLDAIIEEPNLGIINGEMGGQVCDFAPNLNLDFYGTDVGSSNGGGESGKMGMQEGSGMEMAQMAVYPNPATNSITVAGFESKVRLVLTDMHGRVVFDQSVRNEVAVDISRIAPGIYMLEASDDSGNHLNERLMVE